MADDATKKTNDSKSSIALREEEILAFWQEHKIFEKTLSKPSPQGNFVFYDGPPFATGLPHYGHILPGTMKDSVLRYKTMRGFHVPRIWGWDCHGLPIENLVEKELGLKSKKDIEEYGVEKFNEAARATVLRYDADWKKIIPRTGRFIDMDHAYLTMDSTYTESIWWSFKTLYDKQLIYQGFKVMPYCPHCGTTLSNFEVSQGYKDITDISVYAKFELIDEPGTFVVAWTTTPWTLPGNVALAVGPDIEYSIVEIKGEKIIIATERLLVLKDEYAVIGKMKGTELIGKKYKPLFEYYADDTTSNLTHKENAWKIVGAAFVTTTDGTGIVHIAPAFGEDDYNLSIKEKLPLIQHITLDGTFTKSVIDFAGKSAKPKEDPQSGDVEVIKYLAKKGTLFAKEKIIHSYPHCWRCDTPLLNYASSSWFVKVTDMKDAIVAENKKVAWVPQEIGEGRFGKWLEGARDWAISRSRYWGAPLPVWKCEECKKVKPIGSLAELKQAQGRRNTYYVMRHGEAEHNVLNMMSSDPKFPHHLTEHGIQEVMLSAAALKDKKIDFIIVSPFVRTKETADIVAEHIALTTEHVIDDRIAEYNFGDFNQKNIEEYHRYYSSLKEQFTKPLPNGESISDVRKRIGEFLYDIDSKYEGKNILIITHDGPATMLFAIAEGAAEKKVLELWGMDRDFLSPGQMSSLDFVPLPHNRNYELDFHRPYIDNVLLSCDCGGIMKRVPEVFDTWYESGSMPYSKIHYPFEHPENIDTGKMFPADFIAEGQDQTRGWFYSLLVLSTGLFGRSPYKNVLVNGTVLAEDGQKMSKRLKNYPEISQVLDTFGADALRYYLLTSPGVKAQDVLFSEKGLDEVSKKVIARLMNVYSFYALYRSDEKTFDHSSITNVLDLWILSRLGELIEKTMQALEVYELDQATRPVLDFVDDFSTWYVRRSRDRFKGDNEQDKQSALYTTRSVLLEISKLLAPFMPFIAEDIYQKVRHPDDVESVHLEQWPQANNVDLTLLDGMHNVRVIVSEALELRSAAGIKVRQPLQALIIKNTDIGNNEQFRAVIQDELNVKTVSVDPHLKTNVWLDTVITPELKEEGVMRELLRALQDLRKKENLNPRDIVALSVETNEVGQALIKKYTKELSKVAQLKNISFESVGREELVIDGISFKLSLVR